MVKATAIINWKSGELVGAISVDASGSTMGDTMDNLKRAILVKLDKAEDHKAFGWYNVSITLMRE